MGSPGSKAADSPTHIRRGCRPCGVIAAWALLISIPCFLDSAKLYAQTSEVSGNLGVENSLEIAPQATTQELEFVEDFVAGTIEAAIEPSPGTVWTLKLRRHSVRSDRFRILAGSAGQKVEEVSPPPLATWRGSIAELPDSRIFAQFDQRGLTAALHTEAGIWCVQPAPQANLAAGITSHLILPPQEAAPLGVSCGGTPESSVQSMSLAGEPFSGEVAICELSIDADYEFFEANGSSVDDTVRDIEALINAIAPMYADDEIGIVYEIATIVVRTVADDPYVSGSALDLLAEVETTWAAAPYDAFPADLVHLFTGRNLDGSTIGIATLGGVCGEYGKAGLSQPHYSTVFAAGAALVAHEIGHGWNALHCDESPDCQIMCSVITGCTGTYDAFSEGEAQAIADYRATRTCLSELPDAYPLPFIEEFPDAEFAADRWLFVYGAEIAEGGESGAGGDYALVLDAAGAGDLEDDEVRSNRILLGGAEDVVAIFYTRHAGVEESEELIVEFQDNALAWQELKRFTSDGIDEEEFDLTTMLLPAAALHDEFRIRFRAAVDAEDDDWYVDGVRFEALIPIVPELERVSPPAGPLLGGGEVAVHGRNFQPDAAVYLAGVPLADLLYVSEEELRGIVPPHDTNEAVMVEVIQLAGEVRVPDAYLYSDNVLVIESISGAPGLEYWMSATATHTEDMKAFSFGVDYEAADVTVADVTTVGTAADGADFEAAIIDNNVGTEGGWWTIGVVLDLIPPLEDSIPAATGNSLVNFQVQIDEDAESDSEIAVTPRSGLGTVPVQIWFVSDSGAIEPEVLAAKIVVLDGTASFLRCDANRDGAISLADAILALQYLFGGASATCEDAMDSNDDGAISLVDAIYCLGYLFQGAMPPPPPFPDAGEDPTEDELGCAQL